MQGFWRGKRGKRTALIAVGLAVLCCLWAAAKGAAWREALAASAEVANWGLSFQREGEAPLGNATPEYLAQYDALYRRETQEKVLYLTFDAGYENGNTAPILDALKKHGVKATFFLVGNFLETEPDLVRRMAAEGHTIGNHTYSHPDMSQISTEDAFRQELEKNESLYRSITGEEMAKLYRPPQGKYSEPNLKMAQELGYHTVFWSLAYVDWYQDDQPTKEEAFSKLLPRVHPGAVVLLHSTSSTNGEILDELLSQWESLGYTFGDLEQDLLGPAPQPSPSPTTGNYSRIFPNKNYPNRPVLYNGTGFDRDRKGREREWSSGTSR